MKAKLILSCKMKTDRYDENNCKSCIVEKIHPFVNLFCLHNLQNFNLSSQSSMLIRLLMLLQMMGFHLNSIRSTVHYYKNSVQTAFIWKGKRFIRIQDKNYHSTSIAFNWHAHWRQGGHPLWAIQWMHACICWSYLNITSRTG